MMTFDGAIAGSGNDYPQVTVLNISQLASLRATGAARKSHQVTETETIFESEDLSSNFTLNE